MTLAEGAPTAWIAGCAAAHTALLDDLAGLTDAQALQPSRLPEWTVGHVLTHVARNADSVVYRLEGAAAGELRDQYPGGLEQRSADIGAGAGRAAEVLVEDVRRSAAAVDRVLARLPVGAWEAPSRTSRGVVESSRDAVFSRWREVVVHHGDLGLRPVALPPDLVETWLRRELSELAARADQADLLAWLIGRGPAPALSPF